LHHGSHGGSYASRVHLLLACFQEQGFADLLVCSLRGGKRAANTPPPPRPLASFIIRPLQWGGDTKGPGCFIIHSLPDRASCRVWFVCVLHHRVLRVLRVCASSSTPFQAGICAACVSSSPPFRAGMRPLCASSSALLGGGMVEGSKVGSTSSIALPALS
jgi:hypothetical protein